MGIAVVQTDCNLFLPQPQSLFTWYVLVHRVQLPLVDAQVLTVGKLLLVLGVTTELACNKA